MKLYILLHDRIKLVSRNHNISNNVSYDNNITDNRTNFDTD